MLTNPALRTEEEACRYILKVVSELKELKGEVKAVHLNKSLSGAYFTGNHQSKVEEICQMPTFWEQLSFTRRHIAAIDWHVPFECCEIKKVIEAVNPRYLVYELLARNLPQLEKMIARQKAALK